MRIPKRSWKEPDNSSMAKRSSNRYISTLAVSPGSVNSILVLVTPCKPERAGVEHLIYLMGGNVRDTWTQR